MPQIDGQFQAEKQPKYLRSSFSMSQFEKRDPKTGLVVKRNPIRVFAVNRKTFVEWPKGSGNVYTPGGEGAGRYEKGKLLLSKSHQEWTPPLTKDERIARQNAVLTQERDALKLELDAIKKEKTLKAFVADENKKDAGVRISAPKKEVKSG